MIGWTLGRYFAARFLTLILAVFVTICGMVFVVDFVELLRRAGDIGGVTARGVALLSLLRAPSATEQLMPFCVLCGAMAAFLDLTRKLELLIARAVGVSVWGFLAPPAAIAVLTGVLSVALFNPAAAVMRRQADDLEARMFGTAGANGKPDQEARFWIRQKSVDGEAFVKARSVARDGSRLTAATAYVYDQAGQFEAEIEADTALLLDGVWRFDNARVLMPGEEPLAVKNYLLATSLTPEQVANGPVSPDSVPFWDLPAVRDETEGAGLDATAFRLKFQSLLAQPLLFLAMVLIAAAFSLRFFRFGGIAKMVGGGVAAGFVLYVATKLVGDLGGAGLLSATVAAWSPAVVATMLGALALLNQEDG